MSSFAAVGAETLAAALRVHLPDRSWNQVRSLCTTGKVTVDGQRTLDPSFRLSTGQQIAVKMNAPAPARSAHPEFRIVFDDRDLIVVDKPEGIASVPYADTDMENTLDLVRAAWRPMGSRAASRPLYPVHRLDKDTSGLLCFATTKPAERGLHQVFKRHLAERTYVALAHGRVLPQRIESKLLEDRGDGLRGSVGRQKFGGTRGGGAQESKLAVTHVEVIDELPRSTLCRIRLETGRTHQIRIHLAEAGHPLVGESVYIRDFRDVGGALLPTPRLMLHAATLAFAHPITGKPLVFESLLPPAFEATLAALRKGQR